MCTHPLAANQKLDVKGCPKNKQKQRKAVGNETKNDKNETFVFFFSSLMIILVETLYTLWSRDNSDELIFFFFGS